MIDKYTDISVTSEFVVFATIIEEYVYMIVFLGLSDIKDEKNATIIFKCFINHLKIWKLNLCKCMAFDNDGANTNVGSHGRVAIRLKKQPKSIYFTLSLCYS